MDIPRFRPSERILLMFIISAAVLAASMAAPASSAAAPEWRYAAHAGMKLFGGVLLGDERGTYWDSRLPPGWTWLEGREAPGGDYWTIDQILPLDKAGRVIFSMLRWNFVNINLRKGFSEDALAIKIAEIEAAADLRFHPIRSLEEARTEFQAMDISLAPLILEKGSTRLPFARVGFGIMLVRTTSARTLRILIEHYSGAGLMTIEDISPPRETSPRAKLFTAKKIDGPWKTDLDGDGRPDLVWDPGTDGRPSVFTAGEGAKLALVKTFEY